VPIETMEKVFFASIAHDRAGTRGGARDATSDLGHAPRRSSRLPSLGLSRSRRPAGLAPWGAGLGACVTEGGRKGSRGQSRGWSAVSGFGNRHLGWFPWGEIRDRRTPPPAGNARAAVDAGSLTSFFFVPFLATVSNFSTAGSGVTGRSGQRGCGRGMASARRRGTREVYSPPFGFPAGVESAPANEQSGGFRAVDSLSIRAFVAASMSPPYFLSMATTSSSPWPVIEQSV